ncbi:MAG TPA: oligoribonuclease [Oligoflexia bacterium]|nr:oligoribonuclease [Oligoflexia bacterium]HMR25392.1 oligoribonuclease [Oligoflexia bacterium]
MANQKKCGQYLWLDMEMTGLEPQIHKILEVAIIITDEHFNVLHSFETPVFQPPEVLERMDEWCIKTHGESGLTAKIPSAPPITEIEVNICAQLKQHFHSKDKIILAGNSIGQDRKFIDAYMPLLSNMLHYRMVDVSSFKEVFQRQYNLQFEKQNKHRALEDIKESIAELQYYLSFVKQEKS